MDLKNQKALVADYGIGGYYEPHVDYFLDFDSNPLGFIVTGNHVATFTNYMSDVEAGAATVFPYLGAMISPKKGTAIFWYNLLWSGKDNYLTKMLPVLCLWAANGRETWLDT
ncbi:prolyl 4-hydroxylase subunit alpha-2-like [Cervus canadensis]|uniref:prolyl 4-hydroxylase subunit alpha-2-like n=1 Tax=Cervus canadensis TaxID=1574408 RepID=UPI001C9E8E4B|nr:prolyl 4-hydroxylase subunit alpha-2-like [Cervus canadensis]